MHLKEYFSRLHPSNDQTPAQHLSRLARPEESSAQDLFQELREQLYKGLSNRHNKDDDELASGTSV